MPRLELDCSVRNTKGERHTVRVDSIRHDYIGDKIDASDDSCFLSLPGKDEQLWRIKIASSQLQRWLALPQGPETFRVSVFLSVVGYSWSTTIELADTTVQKCSYYQCPDQESVPAQALRLMNEYAITLQVFGHSDAGAPWSFDYSPGHIFLDFQTANYLSFNQELDNLKAGKFIELDLSIFNNRYGGAFMAFRRSSKPGDVIVSRPQELLGGMSFPERYRLLGLSADLPFDSLTQFVDYRFRITGASAVASRFQNNRQYFLYIVCEDTTGVFGLIDSLATQGYRTAVLRDNPLRFIMNHVNRAFREEKAQMFVPAIQSKLPQINQALEAGGSILLQLEDQDTDNADQMMAAIRKYNVWSSHVDCMVQFDARPVRYRPPLAPFAMTRYLLTNFSAATRQVKLQPSDFAFHRQ